MKKFRCSKYILALVVGSLLASLGQSRAAEDETGFKSLFDGKSLAGWSGHAKYWSVKDGLLTGQTTPQNPLKENTFLIYTNANVDDFELRLSYKISGGNSGIQYRSEDFGNFVVGGYQADIDSKERYSGILYEERGRAILADRGELIHMLPDGKKVVIGSLGKSDEIQKAAVKANDWNDYTIIAKGSYFIHMINGRVTAICADDHKGHAPASGILALQLHAGEPMTVQFKNIRIRSMK